MGSWLIIHLDPFGIGDQHFLPSKPSHCVKVDNLSRGQYYKNISDKYRLSSWPGTIFIMVSKDTRTYLARSIQDPNIYTSRGLRPIFNILYKELHTQNNTLNFLMDLYWVTQKKEIK